MARLVSLGVLIGILIAVTIVFYQVMSSFLLPLFLAALVVVVFGPLYRWLLPRCRAKRHMAAALATVAIGAVAILPAADFVALGFFRLSAPEPGRFAVFEDFAFATAAGAVTAAVGDGKALAQRGVEYGFIGAHGEYVVAGLDRDLMGHGVE